ncbi:probable serine/threonine-protein kinase DDB_G0277071 [Nilaparvata lugens]|uniref:probable serine/threonine-protein kinase DDB_G0277071 n=1 Tax=Nilaparvata lugens TaxID=108931 RepID=UPI00193E34C6|nr:probable serine/threonine-protein kinase DDB_G0277071 [Nilaparvata lugens]
MFATSRNIVRSKAFLKLDTLKVERVAFIHVCASRHWSILSKKLSPSYSLSNNLQRLSHVRNLSSNAVVTNQQDTITVYSPGKTGSTTTAPVVDKVTVSDVTATTSASTVTENVATSLPPIPAAPKPPLASQLASLIFSHSILKHVILSKIYLKHRMAALDETAFKK